MLAQPNPSSPSSLRWFQLWLWGGLSLFAVFLCGLIFTGMTSRFMQDDYCFSTILSHRSLVDIYLHETTFSGNRFMLVLSSSLSERLGSWSVQAMPGILLVLWVIGLTLTLRQVILWLVAAGKMHIVLSPITAWLLQGLIAEMIVFLSLYAAPNRVQVFYWRAGSLTYLAPLVVFSYLAWWMIRTIRSRPAGIWARVLTFILAIMAAGYCETAAVFQIGVLSLVSAVILGIRLAEHRPIKDDVWTLFAAWAGTLAAVVILLSSPANAARILGSYQAPPNFLAGVWGALDGAFLFTRLTFYWLPVTSLFVFVFSTLFSYLVQSITGMELLTGMRILFYSVAIALTAYLCIAASMFPSYYIESSYPAERALLTARWISILAIAGIGWMFGSSLRTVGTFHGLQWAPLFVTVALFGVLVSSVIVLPRVDRREISVPEIRAFANLHGMLVIWILVGILAAAAMISWSNVRQAAPVLGIFYLLIILAFIQPAGSSWLVLSEIPRFSARARLWDMRDAQIRQMSASGQQEITVQALDSLAGIGELHADSSFWVNRCAAWYYQVGSIRAVEPVLTLP